MAKTDPVNINGSGQQPVDQPADKLAVIQRRLAELRPALHRFCSRMAGSVIDGEDITQEALTKAFAAIADSDVEDVDRWVFRIARNAALDFLRARARSEARMSDVDPSTVVDEHAAADGRHVASASLKTFMRLPVTQRSCTILVDVLGCSLEETAAITGLTIGAVKAALHRGRAHLKRLQAEALDSFTPQLPHDDLLRLSFYVSKFNAHDFDAVRAMLAEDVELDLVARRHATGKDRVSNYFANYSKVSDWYLVPGLIDSRPGVLVMDPTEPGRPSYFILLEFDGDEVKMIRDFRHARYAADGADFIPFEACAGSG